MYAMLRVMESYIQNVRSRRFFITRSGGGRDHIDLKCTRNALPYVWGNIWCSWDWRAWIWENMKEQGPFWAD